MGPLYDRIGTTYTRTRAADPRVVARLQALLDLPAGARLLDIGAGTGNYSLALAEAGFEVTAVEPSATMRQQARPHARLQWLDAVGEALPVANNTFAGAVMTLCLHHFTDWQQGLREALRTIGNGPLVLFTFDVGFPRTFWLFDYFPEFATVDDDWSATLPAIQQFVETDLQARFSLEPFPLPRDLQDHFAAAGWARPEIYLEQKYRDGISSFSRLSASALESGLARLRADLDNGEWMRKYGELLTHDTHDRGYVFLKIQR